MYQGKPVDAMCVYKIMGSGTNDRTTRLDDCLLPETVMSTDNRWAPDDQGFFGYEYNAEEAGMMGVPYTSYKPVGKLLNGDFVIFNQESGGGTGIFDTIAVVRLTNNTLSLKKVLTGGDRCNGGVFAVKAEGNDVFYSVFMTPADIVNVISDKEIIVPYDDLESSAASCYAAANYKNDTLMGMTLLTDILDQNAKSDDEWVSQYRHQKCFNQYMGDYVAAFKPLDMDMTLAREFVSGFAVTCLGEK